MEPDPDVSEVRQYKKFTEEDSIADLLVYWKKVIDDAGPANTTALPDIPWKEYADQVMRRGTIHELRRCFALHELKNGDVTRHRRRAGLILELVKEDRLEQLATIIPDASTADIADIIPCAIRQRKDIGCFYEMVKRAPRYRVVAVVSRLTWCTHGLPPRILRDVFPEILEVGVDFLTDILYLVINRYNTIMLAEFIETLDGARFATARRTKDGPTLLHCAVKTGKSALILAVAAWLPPSAKKESAFDPPLTPLEFYRERIGDRTPDPEVVTTLSTHVKAAISS